MLNLRSPLDGFKSPFGVSNLGGIRPRSASIVYAGTEPTITGVTILFAAGPGAAVAYAGGVPIVTAPVIIDAGAGGSVTYAGGSAPDLGQVPDGALAVRSGDNVLSRSGDYIINITQS